MCSNLSYAKQAKHVYISVFHAQARAMGVSVLCMTKVPTFQVCLFHLSEPKCLYAVYVWISCVPGYNP